MWLQPNGFFQEFYKQYSLAYFWTKELNSECSSDAD